MRLQPVLAEAAVGYQWDSKRECILHLFEHDALYLFFLFRIDGEVQFIMHLKYHLASDPLCLEALMDADHGYLDDVSGCALNGGVDGVTFCEASYGSVMAVDIRQIAATPKEGSDVALLAGDFLGFLHIVMHLREGLEIAVYQHFSLFAWDIQPLCQAKYSDALDNAEISTFRFGALISGYLFEGFLIDVCCSSRM